MSSDYINMSSDMSSDYINMSSDMSGVKGDSSLKK